MKKVILTMLVAIVGMGFVNAQVYLGGSIGFGMNNSKPKKGDKVSQSAFSFAPEVGYSLNQDLDLGLKLNVLNEKMEDKSKSNSWAIAPYVNYSFVEFGRFGVWGQAELFVGGAKVNGLKSTSFGLNIQPVLKYSLSDNFLLTTNLNFLNVGFNQTKFKNTRTDTRFGIGVDANNVANTNDITVGFLYKF
jgi:hypothetical protein